MDGVHNKCVSFSERTLSDAGIIGGVSSHQNSEQLFQKSYRNYSSIDCDREKRHETPKGAANRKSDDNFLVPKGQKKMIRSQNTPKNNVDEKINPSSSSDSNYNYTFEQARKAISDLEKKRERLERENHQLILKNDQTTQKLSVNNAGLSSSPETDARDQPTVAEVSGDTYGGRSRFIKDKSGKIRSISIESTSIDRTPYDSHQNFDSLLSRGPPKPKDLQTSQNNPSSTQPSPGLVTGPDYNPHNIQAKNDILKEFQLNYNINNTNLPSNPSEPHPINPQFDPQEPNHIETSPIVNPYENSKTDQKNDLYDYSHMGKSKSSDKEIEEIRDQILTRRNNISNSTNDKVYGVGAHAHTVSSNLGSDGKNPEDTLNLGSGLGLGGKGMIQNGGNGYLKRDEESFMKLQGEQLRMEKERLEKEGVIHERQYALLLNKNKELEVEIMKVKSDNTEVYFNFDKLSQQLEETLELNKKLVSGLEEAEIKELDFSKAKDE